MTVTRTTSLFLGGPEAMQESNQVTKQALAVQSFFFAWHQITDRATRSATKYNREKHLEQETRTTFVFQKPRDEKTLLDFQALTVCTTSS